MYEPMDSMQPDIGNIHPSMLASGMARGPQQLPGSMPHQLAARPPVANQETTVPVPSGPPKKSKWEDVSDYDEVWDWAYIIIAVLIVEVFVIGITRFFPDLLGKNLNIWYNRFKLSAVLADVLIIVIGFGIARYVYSSYVWPTYDWNPTYFTGTAVLVQILHDVLFYFGVIRPLPYGQNAMMDVFKDYAESGGAKIIAADSAMMVGSSVISMLLKSLSPHVVISVGLVTAYVLPYILETRNQFSTIA
jgi:hypothetical protein